MNESPPARHFDLLSLDTQVVDQASFAFDSGLLAQLRQFKGRRKRIVLADIVVREITGHVAQWLRTARGKLETARTELTKTGLFPEKLAQQVDAALERDMQAEADSRVQRFIEDIGAEVVSADLINASALVDAYFGVTPPFAATKDKKAEFPDAIALFSLEAFATKNDVRILAVSKDSGWIAYANQSTRIKVVQDLSEALALAQLHLGGEIEEEEQRAINETATRLVENYIEEVQRADDLETYLRLCNLLEEQLEGGGIEVETSGIVETEVDALDIEVRQLSFKRGSDGNFSFKIVRAHPGSIGVTCEIEADLRARAQFSLYGYDSIDKDTFSLGSRSKSGSFTREMNVLLELEGEDGLELDKVGILDDVPPLDFGDIMPDWGPEHDP